MVTTNKTTIAGKLNAARLAISNTLTDPEIGGMVAKYGYTAEKFQEGQVLYEIALANVNARASAAGTQRHATADVRAAELVARASYQSLAQLGRAIFLHEPAHLTSLGLVGTAPRNTAAFLAACEKLFGNALAVAAIKGTLAAYGYDEDRLVAGRAAIDAFERAYKAQTAAKGATQHASRAQRDALRRLNTWIAQYMKIARIALQDKPELIEKLGGAARSSRTAAQRAAAKKAAETRAVRKAA
jgi:hypothetical protein